jgi:hypothetical protein
MPDYFDQCAPVPPGNIAHLTLCDLNEAEREALRNYKLDKVDDTSHCFDLNHRLRSGLPLSTAQLATCKGLDSVFARCPRLIVPTTIYRGDSTMKFLGSATAGETFTCPQFWSTTHAPMRTEAFTGDGGAILKLELPTNMAVYDRYPEAGTQLRTRAAFAAGHHLESLESPPDSRA